MLRKLRKSSRVTLVLIGVAAAATGCSSDDDTRRDVYASREDCLADWNNKPEDCTPATQAAHATRGYWYGPSYYHSSGGWVGGSHFYSGGSSSRALGSTGSSGHSSHIARGGFGSSGRSSGG